eukprot:TRINITY_DN13445_c0_g1_i1.p1 TRINITY_DN13445_c0_g1~~TRINITY_DN13445_c0_g1_i1.p1  ORF type:complete len:414 (-),score=57.59 TRINITY_DN13445_c0_g1_i1:196-1437(-)
MDRRERSRSPPSRRCLWQLVNVQVTAALSGDLLHKLEGYQVPPTGSQLKQEIERKLGISAHEQRLSLGPEILADWAHLKYSENTHVLLTRLSPSSVEEEESKLDQALEEASGSWRKCWNRFGDPYYWNAISDQAQWEQPNEYCEKTSLSLWLYSISRQLLVKYGSVINTSFPSLHDFSESFEKSPLELFNACGIQAEYERATITQAAQRLGECLQRGEPPGPPGPHWRRHDGCGKESLNACWYYDGPQGKWQSPTYEGEKLIKEGRELKDKKNFMGALKLFGRGLKILVAIVTNHIPEDQELSRRVDVYLAEAEELKLLANPFANPELLATIEQRAATIEQGEKLVKEGRELKDKNNFMGALKLFGRGLKILVDIVTNQIPRGSCEELSRRVDVYLAEAEELKLLARTPADVP